MEAAAHLVIYPALSHGVKIKSQELVQAFIGVTPGIIEQEQVVRLVGEFGRWAESAVLLIMTLAQLAEGKARCGFGQFA